MSQSNWTQWFSLTGRGARKSPARSHSQPGKTRPQLEALEARLALSGTPAVDLTTAGAIGSIPNAAGADPSAALFQQVPNQPTGTGVIRSFVRLQAHGAKATVEQGYNSDHRPVQFDENTSPQFTRSLQLSDVPTEDVGGVTYRVFLLDINQKSSQPFLSLDELRLYVGATGDLSGYSGNQLAGLNAVYDMGGSNGAGNWVKLDARLTHGSGSGDMLLYVPNAAFAGASGSYVYLYSKFGVNCAGNGGFEEWAPATGLTSATGVISGNVTSGGVGVPDVVVFLDTNSNGVLDSNEIYTITDSNGNYSFTNLGTGQGVFSTYTVTAVPPSDTVSPFTGTVSSPITVTLTNTDTTVTNVDFTLTNNQVPPPDQNS